MDSLSSVGPYAQDIPMQPKPKAETEGPVLLSFLDCICCSEKMLSFGEMRGVERRLQHWRGFSTGKQKGDKLVHPTGKWRAQLNNTRLPRHGRGKPKRVAPRPPMTQSTALGCGRYRRSGRWSRTLTEARLEWRRHYGTRWA